MSPTSSNSSNSTLPSLSLERAHRARQSTAINARLKPRSLISTKPSRGPWRIEEDRQLIELVRRYGPCHWSSIAAYLPHRSGKQARERWINQLNPALKKKNWTANEDRTILQAHRSLGNKWSAIANMLPGRTDNSVKNRFNSTLRRAIRDRTAVRGELHIDDVVESLHARAFAVAEECAVAQAPRCTQEAGGKNWPLARLPALLGKGRERSEDESSEQTYTMSPLSSLDSGSMDARVTASFGDGAAAVRTPSVRPWTEYRGHAHWYRATEVRHEVNNGAQQMTLPRTSNSLMRPRFYGA